MDKHIKKLPFTQHSKTIDVVMIIGFVAAAIYCAIHQSWQWSALWLLSALTTYVVMRIDPAPKIVRWLLIKRG